MQREPVHSCDPVDPLGVPIGDALPGNATDHRLQVCPSTTEYASDARVCGKRGLLLQGSHMNNSERRLMGVATCVCSLSNRTDGPAKLCRLMREYWIGTGHPTNRAERAPLFPAVCRSHLRHMRQLKYLGFTLTLHLPLEATAGLLPQRPWEGFHMLFSTEVPFHRDLTQPGR